MIRSALILCFVIPNLVWCQTKPSTPINNATAQELAATRVQVTELKKKVSDLEAQVNFLNYWITQKQDRTDEVTIDATEKGFVRLDTNNGPLLISVEDVTPFLNGYKVKLHLGNPTAASYGNYSIKVTWGKQYDFRAYTAATYKEWEGSLHQKETEFTDKLQSGTWNKVDLVLTPAATDELNYIRLSIKSKSVYLSTLP